LWLFSGNSSGERFGLVHRLLRQWRECFEFFDKEESQSHPDRNGEKRHQTQAREDSNHFFQPRSHQTPRNKNPQTDQENDQTSIGEECTGCYYYTMTAILRYVLGDFRFPQFEFFLESGLGLLR
jgi:hypothetical protein